jgi:ribonucleoside-diphosphate reductase alpha chain
MALAETFGEPLWCVGTGMRNTHLRAIAPTVSNSKLSGNISPGIEPWAANVFTDQSAKGTFIRRNPTLEATLKEHNLNTNKVWNQILKDGGSVQDIKELDKIMVGPDKDIPIKEVYKTFKEINQLDLVNQAGIRQQYIDQAVSLNLAFPAQADPKFINKVHLEAWKKGIKTLYYMRTESVLRGDIAEQAMDEGCLSCDG